MIPLQCHYSELASCNTYQGVILQFVSNNGVVHAVIREEDGNIITRSIDYVRIEENPLKTIEFIDKKNKYQLINK